MALAQSKTSEEELTEDNAVRAPPATMHAIRVVSALLLALLALTLLVPASGLLVYRGRGGGRGGRSFGGRTRFGGRRCNFGNTINPDPFAFPNSAPFPSVPLC
ncbi:hypothetical protein FJT64_026923 [Amphibalanus amphitrite]|uniref:Uncharacterized protein n=1 Tax=Amphibalanus amphitrite TaxID=1232801 RepID=A0A6A4W058_AMPAM|nr:hypothetical protein FJT64_026923 [Amphibalanus amphitrite]